GKVQVDATTVVARHSARVKAALDSGPRRLVILEGGHRLSASARRPGRGDVQDLRVTARRLNRLRHPRGAADDNAPQRRSFVRIPSATQGRVGPSRAASPLLEVLAGQRRWHLAAGDCRALLPWLPARSVHCVFTSPPYWGLRDDGHGGQLGREATPEQYVANLVDVFRHVRRVLRDDGTAWLVLGSCLLKAGFAPGGLKPAAARRGRLRRVASGRRLSAGPPRGPPPRAAGPSASLLRFQAYRVCLDTPTRGAKSPAGRPLRRQASRTSRRCSGVRGGAGASSGRGGRRARGGGGAPGRPAGAPPGGGGGGRPGPGGASGGGRGGGGREAAGGGDSAGTAGGRAVWGGMWGPARGAAADGSGVGDGADMRPPFSRGGPRVRRGEFRTQFQPFPAPTFRRGRQTA